MLNHITIMGRLTRDVVTSYAANGNNTAIGRFTIACERDFADNAGQRAADFISCVAFGKTAEFIAKHFGQGNMICVIGRIQTGSYTNKDGQKVYTTDVIVDKVHFTGEKKAAAEESENNDYNYGRPAPSNGDGFMNIPDGIDEELPFN